MKKKFWDLYAPVYNLVMKPDRKLYDAMYERMPETVKDKDVLEIATGTGLLAKHIAHAAKSVTATDFSEGMIREAKKGDNPANLKFEVADAKALPYGDGTFDVVIIANALHIMPESGKALAEARRVLKDDGVLIAPNFVDNKGGYSDTLWSKILDAAGITFSHEWTADEYAAWLGENGWTIQHRFDVKARMMMVYAECVKGNPAEASEAAEAEDNPGCAGAEGGTSMDNVSMSYRALSRCLKIINMRKQLTGSAEEIKQRAIANNKKKYVEFRGGKDYSCKVHTVNGCELAEFHPDKKYRKRAVLVVYGGGTIMTPDSGDIKFAVSLGRKTDRDAWLPRYPLCTDVSMREQVDMIYESYRKMLKQYAPEDIAIFGFSSGGAAAIITLLYNNTKEEKLQMPSMVVAVSPGSIPASEEEKQAMLKLDATDLICPAEYMLTIGELMKHGEDIPQYMLSGHTGDFTGFPETHLFYGGDEILSAAAPYFEEAFRKYGVKYDITIEPHMPHCYANFRFTPECRRGNDRVIELLKRGKEDMSEDKLKIEQNTVQETMLLPLYGRVMASRRWPETFSDSESEKVMSGIDLDVSRANLGDSSYAMYGIRQKSTVEKIKEYLSKYPEATIVDIGCGMDIYMPYVDNGKCRMIYLDFPDVIEMRDKLIPAGERVTHLAGDATDLEWIDRAEIAPDKGFLAVSAGVFYYFQPEQVEKLFATLADRFRGGEIYFDAESRWATEQSNKEVKKHGNSGAEMYFGVDDAEKEIMPWSSNITGVHVSTPKEIAKYIREVPLGIRVFLKAGVKIGLFKFITVKFK